jgi:hypothetical protein
MSGPTAKAGSSPIQVSQHKLGVPNGQAAFVSQQSPQSVDTPTGLPNAAEGLPERRRAPRSPRAQLFVTISHWSMVLFLALSLLSGMRIGWAHIESSLGGSTGVWGGVLGAVSPKGTLLGLTLIDFHVVAAFGMLLVAGVYAGYMLRSRASRRLQLTGQDLRKLSLGIRTGGFWRNKAALWSANLLVYWAAFGMITILAVTGTALYRLDWGLSTVLGGYDAARFVHGLLAYLLVPYTVLHIVLQWFFGRFWTIFKAQFYGSHLRAGLVSLAVVLPVVAGLYLWNEMPETLTVVRMGGDVPAPVLDGDPSDAAWKNARAVTIRTVKGVNNPQGHVDVTVKALHDGQHIYFQYEWRDADVSAKRWPLMKTASGWRVLQTAFETWDENVYYEDKLAMYITDVPNGSCAGTCHLGEGPHSAKGDKHGLHYTRGEVGDLWHWKSVRTNAMGAPTGEPGFLDDQHFRGREPVPAKLTKRYTGGYYGDPGRDGYILNFEKLDPSKPVSETLVRPLFFPPTNGIAPNPDPATSEQGVTWWIQRASAIPYTAAADTYPVGTLLPNVVIQPNEGDRADVRGQAQWRQGRWTLEARRALDTKSRYDVAFLPGKPVYISVATYNRTETRHTEHIRPVRVLLQR